MKIGFRARPIGLRGGGYSVAAEQKPQWRLSESLIWTTLLMRLF